jgi:hypothetical protein
MGIAPHYTSPPKKAEDFAEFAVWAVRKYAMAKTNTNVLIGAK